MSTKAHDLVSGAAKGGIFLSIAGLFTGAVLPAVIIGGASIAVNEVVDGSAPKAGM